MSRHLHRTRSLNLSPDNSKIKLKIFGGSLVISGMVNWQLTAITIYCDAIDEEVTVMVYKDWSTRCTGFNKYSHPGKETSKNMSRKSGQTGRNVKCKGPECPLVIQYRDKLKAEEKVG
jgi:hypothetical protein